MILRNFLAPLMVLVLTSCMLPPNVVILMQEDSGVGQASISNAGGTVNLDKPYLSAGGTAGTLDKPFAANFAEVDYEFGRVLAAIPRPPVKFTLYFLEGQAELDPASVAELDAVIAKVKATPHADLSVIGHADATGAEDVNVRVSRARAATIRDRLVAAGIPDSIMEVGSHGSANPRVPAARGVPEPKNRRVEITIR